MGTISRTLAILFTVFLMVGCAQKKGADQHGDRYWTKMYREQGPECVFRRAKRTIDSLGTFSPGDIGSYVRRMSDLMYERDSNLAAAIAAYSYGMEVSPDRYSETAARLLTAVRLPGNDAPGIDGCNIEDGPLIVLFYESDCSGCIPVVDDLILNYDLLRQYGYTIVSVASDTDRALFERTTGTLPWRFKLCDYRSFDSPNFRRWGVASTPVLYLVDEEGKVAGSYARLQEMFPGYAGISDFQTAVENMH